MQGAIPANQALSKSLFPTRHIHLFTPSECLLQSTDEMRRPTIQISLLLRSHAHFKTSFSLFPSYWRDSSSLVYGATRTLSSKLFACLQVIPCQLRYSLPNHLWLHAAVGLGLPPSIELRKTYPTDESRGSRFIYFNLPLPSNSSSKTTSLTICLI